VERKKEADSLQAEDKKIELLLQEAFDYSDEQLLKELEMAEAQVKSAKMAAQDRQQSEQDSTAAEGMTAPLGEFEKILEKMSERGISTELEKELNSPNPYSSVEPDIHLRAGETSELERPPEAAAIAEVPHTKRRFRPGAWKLLLAAAMAGGLLWAGGIGVSGRKQLEYKANVRDSDKSNIAWNNESENYIEADSEEEAYKIIGEKLGIPVLKIGYRPEGMEFSRCILKANSGVLEYTYCGKNIHFIQGKGYNENSDTFSSDRKEYVEIKNEWLGRTLQIEKNLSSKDNIEYSITFEKEKNFYYLGGIFTEEEFKAIVADLNF
jgi:hypothetical protein